MDIMRKILRSPLTRRRGQNDSNSSSTAEVQTVVGNGLASSGSKAAAANNTFEGGGVEGDVVVLQPRYFGVELGEIISRDGTDVPRLLLNLAQCICTRG